MKFAPKIALLRAPMVVTYYIKLFHTGADRHKRKEVFLSQRLRSKILNNNYKFVSWKTLYMKIMFLMGDRPKQSPLCKLEVKL